MSSVSEYGDIAETLILESISEAIYVTDINGICTFVNSSCINLLGYSADDLIGHNIHQMIHYSCFDGNENLVEDISNHKGHTYSHGFHSSNEIFCCKDGCKLHVEYWSQPVKRADNIIGTVVTFINISNRIETEHQLKLAKQEADKANLAKSEFLARMSHELRTPLNAIMGFSQLMEYDKSLSKNSIDSAREIHHAGHHLLSLINDILDLSKIESGKIHLKIDKISLKDFIKECATLTAPLASQSACKLIFDINNIPDHMVNTDSTRLKEVLLNLLSNAVKYNSSNGTIRLYTEEVDNCRIRINVSDTGKGLSDLQQSKLFKPFERLGAENTNIEGTGIGLVISKHIIEILGGKIGVRSIPGKGSTFWIEFSYVDTKDTKDTKDSNPAYFFTTGPLQIPVNESRIFEVLYVEDTPSNIRVIEYSLSQFPFINLRIATTGEAGLKLIDEQEPDLIITDINLPGISGYDLLKKVRSSQTDKVKPILAVTVNATKDEIENGYKQGFTEYMTKPVNIPNFMSSVLKHLDVQMH